MNANYERRDANFRRVMTSAAGLLGIMAAGLIFSWLTYEIFIAQTENPGARAEMFTEPDTTGLPAGPRLQADPRIALADLRAREDSILGSYGWVDSAKGVARVPVARAMELYLESVK